ncbi:MAG TPA: hypothetical protein VG940_02610 [Gemmatimonadales bacterium]|nr:hypothetical protein [Gemmatimonadales bacterium]
MRSHHLIGLTALLCACATAGLGEPAGRAALAPADAAELKTRAVKGAREELARTAGSQLVTQGLYLDTLVGPTPEEYFYTSAHPTRWLEAMVANHLVDGTFGIGSARQGYLLAIALEVGEPFLAGPDTLGIIYSICQRRLPSQRGGHVGGIDVWQDRFVRADTGWARVAHGRTVAPMACTP